MRDVQISSLENKIKIENYIARLRFIGIVPFAIFLLIFHRFGIFFPHTKYYLEDILFITLILYPILYWYFKPYVRYSVKLVAFLSLLLDLGFVTTFIFLTSGTKSPFFVAYAPLAASFAIRFKVGFREYIVAFILNLILGVLTYKFGEYEIFTNFIARFIFISLFLWATLFIVKFLSGMEREMNEKLYKIEMDTIKKTVGTIRHELNNALTPIIGAIDLLTRKAEINEELKCEIELIQKNSLRIINVLKKLENLKDIKIDKKLAGPEIYKI